MSIAGREPELILTDITAPANGGTYDCIVINDAGFGHNSGTLYVLPTIVQDPMDTLARAGDVITLTCLAESFPYPTYQWQMMNRISGFYDNITGETEASLTPFAAAFSSFGRYRCVASNVIDGIERTVSSSSALLTGKLNHLKCCDDDTAFLLSESVQHSQYHFINTVFFFIHVHYIQQMLKLSSK